MADKEATVYIIDVGKSMGRKRHGRDQTDLEWAMIWIWDKITSVVATERKTLLQGVIALRTDGTNNEMGDEDGYHHLSVVHEISQVLLPDLKNLRRVLKPSQTDAGDIVSALALALILIDKTCKKLKYRKNIVIVTDGEGVMDASDLDEISKKINQDAIKLTILGVDFDDSDYHDFREEAKGPRKERNEAILKRFVDDCGGIYGTLSQAIAELGEPRLKETRPVPSYRGWLTLGDPKTYPDTAVVIDVERYPRTMIRRPQTASSFVVVPPGTQRDRQATDSTDTVMGGTEENGQAAEEVSQIRNQISYFVNDPDAPDGKLRVERDDLARGYEYGRTAVYISEADENITKFQTKMGLEIMGFIPWANFERYVAMSNSHVIVASKANSKAIMALSSFIRALYELESFAIARMVTKDGKEPTVEVLAPSIEADFECLININLPFAEDIRPYKFPSLDKVVTVSGKVLKEHRLLPDEKLIDLMDEYVDTMDLSQLGRDEDDKPEEYLKIQDAFSPVLHHIDQAVRWRAAHPDDPLPIPYEILTRYRQPPQQLRDESQKVLAKMAAAANVKKVPPKFVGRRRKESTKPLSGLDIDSLLNKKGDRSIDANNSIPSLRQMLDTADDSGVIKEACEQMGNIIEKRVSNGFGDSVYEQVLEELRVLREEMHDMEEPALWNTFIKRFKEKIRRNDLGEGRDELWFLIRRAKLGLIEGKFPGGGEVTQEEAADFLRMRWDV